MAIDLNISTTYSLKGFSRNDFSVEMARQPDSKALMEWVLEEYVDLKPWEEVEEVYYKHVESSMGKSIHFYFLSDGECFFMRVSRELIDEIRKTDPEALNGALFELRKIDL